MSVFDLIPFPDKIKTLFVLESPHFTELDLGFPCAGTTGINMSKAIVPSENHAFGELLFTKANIISEYGVINSCTFPLGVPERLTLEQLEISKIKLVQKSDSQSRDMYYNSLCTFLSNISDLDGKIKYSQRLKSVFLECPLIENLVFCGFISQAIFLTIFKVKNRPQFNKLTQMKTKSNRKINILFVNHPSSKNESWTFKPIQG